MSKIFLARCIFHFMDIGTFSGNIKTPLDLCIGLTRDDDANAEQAGHG